MKIAFWTAYTFVRLLHTLQRWGRGFSLFPIQNIGMYTEPRFTVESNARGAFTRTTTQTIPEEQVRLYPMAYRPAALTPVHFFPPCNLRTPTSLHKVPRNANRSTSIRCPGAQNPLRILHCSTSTQEAGHFFIAGRVADVCAELERLAAREAAH